MAMNPQLAALAAALGGGNQRFYTAPAAEAAPTPIQAPAASAGTADALLARALSGRAPNTMGQGIYSGLTSIGAGLAARSKRQQAEADQAKQTAGARDMLAQLTTGTPGTLNAGELPAVPTAADAGADPNAAAALMGLDRPAGEMTTGGRAPTYDPGDPMAMLANTLIDQGQGAKVPGFFAADLSTKAATKAKADALRQGMQFDLLKQANQANLRATTPKSPEVVAQETAINAARAGYQPGPGGGLQPIPGGPTDPAALAQAEGAKKGAQETAKFEAAFPKVRQQINSMNRDFSNLTPVIDRAIANSGFWTTGVLGKNLSALTPDAINLRNDLETIRANLGFGRLKQMREESPTGGALGQVSEMENRLLQAVDRALQQDQSAGRLKANLLDVKTNLALVQEEKNQAFRQDYGKFLGPDEAAKDDGGGGPPPPAANIDDIMKKYR